jgi:hypothetical protein
MTLYSILNYIITVYKLSESVTFPLKATMKEMPYLLENN